MKSIKVLRKAFIMGSLLVLFGLVGGNAFLALKDRKIPYDALKIFSQVFSLTANRYVEEVNSQKLMEKAEKGLVNAIDPFSYYVPPSKANKFQSYLTPSPGRIDAGVEVMIRGSICGVINVLEGSPADKAGLRVGDVLEKVEGTLTTGLDPWEISLLLRGKPGEEKTVERTAEEGDSSETINITLFPFEVPLPALTYQEGIPYIKLHRWDEACYRALVPLLEALQVHTPLIIDLRHPFKGDYLWAVRMAQLFTTKPLKVWLKKPGEEGESIVGKGSSLWKGKELLLLVDSSIKGPAELFGALLKNYADATLVGQNTFGWVGKQEILPFSQGGILYLTTQIVSLPDGTSFHQEGLKPDFSVMVWREEKKKDLILQKAIQILKEKLEPAA